MKSENRESVETVLEVEGHAGMKGNCQRESTL